MADIKKFLDSDGLTILCRKFQEYPDNEILGTVISAIDSVKVDKEEGKVLSSNDYTNEDKNKLNDINSITIEMIDTICNAIIYEESEIKI